MAKLPAKVSGSLTYNLQFTDPYSYIEQHINEQLIDHLKTSLRVAQPRIERKIKELFREHLENSDPWISMKRGILHAEFGFDNPDHFLTPVLTQWLRNTTFEYKFAVGKRDFPFSFTFKMIQEDFEDVFAVHTAQYISKPALNRILRSSLNEGNSISPKTINRIKKNALVQWLRWILQKGHAVIVRDYEVGFNLTARQRHKSRSKEALMFNRKGSLYRVYSPYAGTIKNNFVTKVIDGMEMEVFNILEKEFLRALK